MPDDSSFEGVRDVLAATLGIEDRAELLDSSTPLLGSLPELDSMAVVELIAALTEQFEIEVDDSDITGEVFETLGSLVAFIDARRALLRG